MPFERGQPKPEGSGRKKGSGNRATVASILEANDCDPIEELVKLAQDTETKRDLKVKIYAELAAYRWPKLRSVEHSGPGGGAIEVQDVSPTELLRRRIAGLSDRLRTTGSTTGT